MNTVVEQKDIENHFARFYPSLNCYLNKYAGSFFIDPKNILPHIAYLCPLCLKSGIIYEPSFGLGMHAEFSLDHFPPKSVGGFLKILVCKKCNNDAGGIYENSLKEKMRNMSFNKGIFSSHLNAKAKIITPSGDAKIPGRYSSRLSIDEEGKIEISLKPKTSVPVPHLDKWIEDSKTDTNYKIELTVPVADESKVSKSLLKAAYLFCFDSWGYDFAYSESGEKIRKVLHDEIGYPAKTPSFWLRETIEKHEIPFTPLGLCYLKKPAECKCFMINMILEDITTGYKNLASVLIPNPTKEGWDDLARIQTYFDANPETEISMAHVTDFTLHNGLLDGYHQSWLNLIDEL